MVSLRLPEELLEWATGYAESRGVSRTDLLVEGLRSFKEGCERGVPEIRAAEPRAERAKAVAAVSGGAVKFASDLGESQAALNRLRQQRLNAMRERAKK